MRLRFVFAWYDLWVGAFWDRARRRLYLFPIPMFGVVIEFGRKSNLERACAPPTPRDTTGERP